MELKSLKGKCNTLCLRAVFNFVVLVGLSTVLLPLVHFIFLVLLFIIPPLHTIVSYRQIIVNDIISVYYSRSEIHTTKSEDMLKTIVEKLKLKPEQCLLIDDSNINIEKAKELGMNALLFKTNSELFNMLKAYDIETA